MKKSYYWFLVLLILGIEKKIEDTLLINIQLILCMLILGYFIVDEYIEKRKKNK